jgi:hypothetical protein
VAQSTNVAIDVTAAQLASTTFQSGSAQMTCKSSDGKKNDHGIFPGAFSAARKVEIVRRRPHDEDRIVYHQERIHAASFNNARASWTVAGRRPY